MQNPINQNICAQEQFTECIQESVGSAETLVQTIMGLSVVRSIIGMVERQVDAAMNRMDTMTNYSRTMTAITGSADLANASLEVLKDATKGTAYGLDTAATATQNFVTRGMAIGAAVNEVQKWSDAVAFYGNGTNETLLNVTDALGKMLTKGTVEMDQLDRLTDAGINAVGIYAQATGQSTAVVQDYLSKGKISAQDFITTVSTAFSEGTNGVLNISGAAKEAGNTWETSIANARAAVTRGLISIADGINEGLANAGLGTMLDGIQTFGSTTENVLNHVGMCAGSLITFFSPAITFISNGARGIADNWSIIAPVIYIVVGALIAYRTAQGVAVLATEAGNFVNALYAVGAYKACSALAAQELAIYGKVSAETMAAIATSQATAAQYGLNAAILACPVTWIVVAILATIAILYMAVAAINKTKGTTISATGLICGTVAAGGAFIGNVVIGLVNTIISIGVAFWNLMENFANSFAVIFNDPVKGIAAMFLSLFNFIVGIVQSAASLIDTVLGSNLADAVGGFQDKVQMKIDAIVTSAGGPVAETKNAADYQLDRITYNEAWNKGYNLGQGTVDKITGIFNPKTMAVTDHDYTSALAAANNAAANNVAATAANTADTAKNTAKTANTLSASSEDLKYLRDIADRDYVNKFTTAQIKVEMINHNNVSNDMDLDGVVEHMRSKIEEQMRAAAEGEHE